MTESQQPPTYRCPDEQHPIARAVHLGRLAAFYPACRQCPHRDDTGTLSPRQIEQLQEVRSSGQRRPLFHDEGAGGVYLNDLSPAAARDIAIAFGSVIRGEGREQREEGATKTREKVGSGQSAVGSDAATPFPPFSVQHSSFIIHHSPNPQPLIPNPSVLLAGDGRPITVELLAAAGEGLRASGCDVVDIGPATAACLAFAVHHFQAAGGLLLGNPSRQSHIVDMQFWAAGPRPLSAGGPLERIAELYRAGVDRPARSCGALRRTQADAPYLAAVSEYYHALRPLRVMVDSASGPLVDYLQKLTAAVACEVNPCRVLRADLSEQIRAGAAHFAVCSDGNAETCCVLDEQGREVPTERLLMALACQTLCASSDRAAQPPVILLEESTPRAVSDRIATLGARVIQSGGRRAEMAAAISEQDAVLGGGLSGRFWHRVAGVPLPDALMTITRLLILLSRSDDPFSVVLDRDAPVG